MATYNLVNFINVPPVQQVDVFPSMGITRTVNNTRWAVTNYIRIPTAGDFEGDNGGGDGGDCVWDEKRFLYPRGYND